MVAVASGADVLANTLLSSLTAGVNFSVPDINLDDPIFAQPGDTGQLYEAIEPLNFNALTTGVVGGTGVFDKLMVSLVNHLKIEFAANRISGAEYTKAYVGVITAALQTSEQFLLAKDQAYWSALLVQSQARAAEAEIAKARIELEIARVTLVRAQFEAATTEVNYSLTKMKLSTEDITYDNLVKSGTNLTKQGANMDVQTDNLTKQGVGIDYTNTFMLPEQKKLLVEQTEVQRSQTMDKRMDGTTNVTGLVGKQKDLYAQQIVSYQRDAEVKAAKIWADAYTTQLTILGGANAPDQFKEGAIQNIMTKIRTNLDIA